MRRMMAPQRVHEGTVTHKPILVQVTQKCINSLTRYITVVVHIIKMPTFRETSHARSNLLGRDIKIKTTIANGGKNATR